MECCCGFGESKPFERTEDEISNVFRNNNEWIKTAEDQEG